MAQYDRAHLDTVEEPTLKTRLERCYKHNGKNVYINVHDITCDNTEWTCRLCGNKVRVGTGPHNTKEVKAFFRSTCDTWKSIKAMYNAKTGRA